MFLVEHVFVPVDVDVVVVVVDIVVFVVVVADVVVCFEVFKNLTRAKKQNKQKIFSSKNEDKVVFICDGAFEGQPKTRSENWRGGFAVSPEQEETQTDN